MATPVLNLFFEWDDVIKTGVSLVCQLKRIAGIPAIGNYELLLTYHMKS
jgi:hypothetical protein